MRKLAGIEPQLPSEIAATKGGVFGIVGLPDAGKTTTVETLCNDESCYPVCLLNNDGGAHVIHDHYVRDGKIAIYQVSKWNKFEQTIDELVRDPNPFKSIWLDVVSGYADAATEEHDVHALPTSDSMGRRREYGEINWDVTRAHRRLIDELAQPYGINVFFVYWSTRPVRNEGGAGPIVTAQRVALSPQLSLKVTGILDVIVYIEKQEGLNPYPPRMRLWGSQAYETRMRLSPDNPLKKWPMIVENPDLSKVVRAFHGEIFTKYSPD